jgi:hypothetical protein
MFHCLQLLFLAIPPHIAHGISFDTRAQRFQCQWQCDDSTLAYSSMLNIARHDMTNQIISSQNNQQQKFNTK